MDWPVCKLQVHNLVLIEFAQAEQKKVNKQPKFENNFDVWQHLEHFEYELIHAWEKKSIFVPIRYFSLSN